MDVHTAEEREDLVAEVRLLLLLLLLLLLEGAEHGIPSDHISMKGIAMEDMAGFAQEAAAGVHVKERGLEVSIHGGGRIDAVAEDVVVDASAADDLLLPRAPRQDVGERPRC
jgi:hypothetical protein